MLVSALCGFILRVFGDTSLSYPHVLARVCRRSLQIGVHIGGSHIPCGDRGSPQVSPLDPHGLDTYVITRRRSHGVSRIINARIAQYGNTMFQPEIVAPLTADPFPPATFLVLGLGFRPLPLPLPLPPKRLCSAPSFSWGTARRLLFVPK